MKKTSSGIEKMLFLIQMRFMKYETRRFSETHSLKRKRRLQQKKIYKSLNLSVVFSTSSKFLSVIVETVELFQKGMRRTSFARSERDALSVFIAYCQHYSGTYLLQAALIIRSLGIRSLYYSQIRKQGKTANNKEKKHYFRPKLLVLIFVGSKFLRFVTLANSEGNLYELQRKSKVRQKCRTLYKKQNHFEEVFKFKTFTWLVCILKTVRIFLQPKQI